MSHQAEQRLQRVVETLKRWQPGRIILFGSRARGDHTPRSDFDIAVDMIASPAQQRQMREAVEDAAGLYSVDLIFLPETDASLRQRIEQEGITLYESGSG